MRLGICPCCTTVITGIYDFYNIGAYQQYVSFNDDTDIELENIFVRHPSRRIQLNNDVYTTQPVIDIVSSARITSFIEDWQIPYSSGREIRDAEQDVSFYFDSVHSIDRTDKDYVWALRNTVRPISSYHYYNYLSGDAGSGLGTGWNLGPHTRLDGNNIVLTTGDTTSGCYIEFPIGTGVVPKYLNFQISQDYDKYVLITMRTSPDMPDDYSGYNVWISPTGKSNTNTLITEINPTGASNFNPGRTMHVVDNYLNYLIDWNNLFGPGYDRYFDYDLFTGIRISLVDNRSGYTIDDVSGYSCDIRQIYLAVGDVWTGGEPYPPSYNSFSFSDLALFDSNNRDLLYYTVPETGGSFTAQIIATDFAKYNSITGYSLSEHDIVFGNVTTGQSGLTPSPYYGTSHSTMNFMPCTAASPGFFVNDADLIVLPTTFGHGNFYLVHNVCNTYTINTVTNHTDKIAFIKTGRDDIIDYNQPIYRMDSFINIAVNDNINSNYDVILTYDSDGDKTFEFGERVFLGTIEHALPEEELRHYAPSYQSGTDVGYVPVNINNYNTDRNIPRIQVFSQREFPSCFSIKEPKPVFTIYTGGTSTTGITQNLSILFGPYIVTGYDMSLFAQNNLTGISGTDYTEFRYGNSYEYTGYLYSIHRQVICGDENNSQVFWSTGVDVTRTLTQHYGNIYKAGATRNTISNIYESSPSIAAHVLWGDSYYGTPGAIFVYSLGSGDYSNGSITGGSVWINVKIGDNIVFTQRCWDGYSISPQSTLIPARGLTALHRTESTQVSNMSGNYAAFAWYERIWSGSPSGGGTANPSGWKLHVSNATGMDLWTLDSTGEWSNYTDNNLYGDGTGPRYRHPKILGSSDRYIYLYDFFYPYSGLVSPNFDTYSEPTGGTSSGEMYHVYMTGDYINAGHGFAVSHDGRSMIPISVQYRDAATTVGRHGSGWFVSAKIGNYDYDTFLTFDTLNQPVWDINFSDTIKNSNRLSLCPPYSPTTGIFGNWSGIITGEVLVGSGIYQSGLLP